MDIDVPLFVDKLRIILIGENMDILIHDKALTYLILSGTSSLMTLKDKNNKSIFTDNREAFEHLSDNKELTAKLEKSVLRTKFAITVLYICGLIIYHKDKVKELLGEEKSISSLKVDI